MRKYIIEGGYPIKGTIKASGNKNAALPCISASLLTSSPIILKNIPEIEDVHVMFEIFKVLGGTVEKIKNNDVIIIIPKTEKLHKKGDILKPLKILIFLLTTIIPPFSFFYNIQYSILKVNEINIGGDKKCQEI